jgi:hypothetical protein
MVNLFSEILTMGEEKAEAAGGETSSLSAEAPISGAPVSHVSQAQNEPQNEPASASSPQAPQPATDVASPALVPEHDAAAEMSEEAACDNAKAEAAPVRGKVVVIPFGDRGHESGSTEREGRAARRRFAAMATMVVLATCAGVFGGALATAALSHGPEAVDNSPALAVAVARIDADILALKASLEFGSKLGQSQFSKTSERLDKIEKAQAEPAAKLARLGEAVDKLRAVPVPLPSPVAAAPAAAKDVTGSVSPSSPATAPKVETQKTDVGKLPTVEDWVLRDVGRGGALIDGRRGLYEVYAGDFIPGLGRIDAIRRQDGRWVVVTSKGLIVAR